MKPAREWDEAYILSLPVQEYDDIEFKAPRWLDLSDPTAKDKTLTELAKELSALANLGGGYLVLGVKDPKHCKSGVLEIVDGGVPKTIGKTDTAEWLRAAIPVLLEFELRGFEVHPVENKGPSSMIQPDKAVFVIGIPDSEDAPHQSKRDHKYYLRVGGNSHPIGHRVVMDIFGRRRHPKIELIFSIEVRKGAEEVRSRDVMGRPIEVPIKNDLVTLRITATNTSKVFAQYVKADVILPIGIFEQSEKSEKVVAIGHLDYYQHHFENTRRDPVSIRHVDYNQTPARLIHDYGPSWFDPILPGRSMIWEVPLKRNCTQAITSLTPDLIVKWTTFADNALPHSGELYLRDIPIQEIEGRQ